MNGVYHYLIVHLLTEILCFFFSESDNIYKPVQVEVRRSYISFDLFLFIYIITYILCF